MKAKNITGQAPGGKRVRLAEVLPLRTPFMIEIYPMYACNFRCKYCMMSLPSSRRPFVSDKIVMDFDLYKKCIDDITAFPDKLKILRFGGIGEPLLHKNIADMVEYAASKNIAEKIEIITNGSLLTPEMSDALISAGVSRLIVSVQGTTKEKYKEISGVNIDFENFISNLRYFFEHKGKNIQIYIKIADEGLEDKEDEKKFYKLFGDICDLIAVEHIVPIQPSINYKKVLKEKDKQVTQFGLPALNVLICPQPFFTLRINTDGKVIPCYAFEFPAFVGDCNKQSVSEIWNGKEFQKFRYKMLNGIKKMGGACARCKIIKHRIFPEDIITLKDAERLRKFYD
jgi:radical SAM protein with 4Fe4S-binding SPASM domain